jgi:hypothetical protein
MRNETSQKFHQLSQSSDHLQSKIAGTQVVVQSILNDTGSGSEKIERSKNIMQQIGAQLDGMQQLLGELISSLDRE